MTIVGRFHRHDESDHGHGHGHDALVGDHSGYATGTERIEVLEIRYDS